MRTFAAAADAAAAARLHTQRRRRARRSGLAGATCGADTEHDALVRLLSLAASTNRGQSATLDQKYDIENAISDLEESASITRQMNMATSPLLNGKWALVYASERETRSSPFFWAFRKALKGVEQPFPVLPGELAESFFAITDGLPFYSVGRASQYISGVGTAKATLVSSVQVNIHVCIYIHTYMYVCILTCIHTCVHTYVYTCMHTYIHE